MRLLIDVHKLGWDEAWEITRATIAYTNHTLLPEALESWPVSLFERLLPRHMQIIYEINAQLLEEAGEKLGEDADLSHLSLIDEHGGRRVRMGQLAFVGSHSVNGVSALHTELMKKTCSATSTGSSPDRITNKTNGITFRRWLMLANPRLTDLIRETIGDGFLDNLDLISGLNAHADDAGFQERFAEVKRANKARLASVIRERLGITVDPGRAVRRPDQAHPRIQAAAAQHPRGGRALQPDPLASGTELGAAREDLRRQGGGELLAGEADHPADQRRRPRGQQRSRRARAAQGRVHAELQCQPRRGDHSGRRSLRADLDRRAWKPPAPAT